jgi:tetratricopeptide (TPR) repeat protein
MKQISVLLLCFLLMSVSTFVEAQQVASLRAPSVEEYLAALPQISSQSEDDPYIRLVTYLELVKRYPDFAEQPFDALQEIARIYRLSYSFPVSAFADNNNQNTWNTWLIDAWLRENGEQLETADHLQFGDFDVQVTRADLSGDGESEYLLYILEQYPASFEDLMSENYIAYWVLQRDKSSATGYRWVETPLSWFRERRYSDGGINSGNLFTYAVQDVSGDGVLDWVVISAGFAGGGFGTCRTLGVLSWQDGALGDLVETPLRYCRSTVESSLDEPLLNVEYSLSSQEISQTYRTGDTWRCGWEETERYQWDGERFIPMSMERRYDETFNCAVKAAEAAMWDGDIETAVEFYEQGQLLLDDELDNASSADTEAEELRQYAAARLSIAYAMLGREADARAVINELTMRQPASDMMRQLINHLSEPDRAIDVCLAAYQVFEELTAESFDYDLPTKLTVGFVNEHYSFARARLIPPPPADAGCDVAEALNRLLEAEPSADPLETLSEIPISEVLTDDLNADDRTDWLIRIRDVEPLFMVESQPQEYQVQETLLSPAEYSLLTMPDDSNAVLQIQTEGLFGYGCPNNESVRIGVYYQAFDNPNFSSIVCADDFDPSQLLPFGDGRELHLPHRDDAGTLTTDIYQWDAEQAEYMHSNGVRPDQNIPQADLAFQCGPSGTQFCPFYQSTESEEQVLAMLDEVLTTYPELSSDTAFVNAVRYRRALALEALNRPDEALAAYLELYETDPDTAWGQLAALHLDVE